MKYTNSFFTWKNLKSLSVAKLNKIKKEFNSSPTLYYFTPMKWIYRVEVILGDIMPDNKAHHKYMSVSGKEKRRRLNRVFKRITKDDEK